MSLKPTLIDRLKQQLVKRRLHTKRILLIDGLGAFISATLLFSIQLKFEATFGLPIAALKLLTLVAVIFSLYSLTCYFVRLLHWQRFLFVIFSCNILYCLLTLLVLFNYRTQVTSAAVLYFSLEIAIVLLLARAEWFAINYQNSDQR